MLRPVHPNHHDQAHGMQFGQQDLNQSVTSTIIGATTMEQLKTCIDSVDLDITKEIINEIRSIHKEIPNPAP